MTDQINFIKSHLQTFIHFSGDVAAGVRRQRGAAGLGLAARAGRGGAGRHHDRRAQAGLREGEGEGREGEEGGQLIGC